MPVVGAPEPLLAIAGAVRGVYCLGTVRGVALGISAALPALSWGQAGPWPGGRLASHNGHLSNPICWERLAFSPSCRGLLPAEESWRSQIVTSPHNKAGFAAAAGLRSSRLQRPGKEPSPALKVV